MKEQTAVHPQDDYKLQESTFHLVTQNKLSLSIFIWDLFHNKDINASYNYIIH